MVKPAATLVVLVTMGAGCASRTTPSTDGAVSDGGGDAGIRTFPSTLGAGRQLQYRFEVAPPRQLDLLFVIDDAGPSMAARQEALGRAFPRLLDRLGRVPGGVPDLHVGVVSSDLGAGPTPVPGCARVGGDRGILQARPGCGLAGGARFLAAGPGGITNFQGDLATAFGCLARLGTGGCPYPHALHSARVALYEAITPENKGFLRENAYLAIVVLSDEDDCSADINSDLFGSDFAGTPRLRCAVAGHLCGGVSPPAMPFIAPLSSCEPARDGRLIRVDDIVASVRKVKPWPDQQLVVASLAGWPADPAGATYRIGAPPGGSQPDLLDVCGAPPGAVPALRLHRFAEAMGAAGLAPDLCSDDLGPAMDQLGAVLVSKMDASCLPSRLFGGLDPSRPPECEVVDLIPEGAGIRQQAVPRCSDSSSRPCWIMSGDSACSADVRVTTNRLADPPPGTQQVVRCSGAPLTAGPCPDGPGCPPPPTGAVLGQVCELEAASIVSSNEARWKAGAPECPSRLCAQFSPAYPGSASSSDTGPVCTAACTTDADCLMAERRDPTLATDRRCKTPFVCRTPFHVGPLSCQRLCLCADFRDAGLTSPPEPDPACPTAP